MATRRERLERKVEKRRDWAQKATVRSEQRFTVAHERLEQIPPGQPILVGHHSEARHRRDLERIDNNMRAGIEAEKLAEHHTEKADGLELQLDHTIFSDDPDAIEAIEARIKQRIDERERMKQANALYRKGNVVGLQALGFDYTQLQERVARGYAWEKLPFPAYALSNLGARIRADQDRVKIIKARAKRTEQVEAHGGLLIEGGDYVRVTFAEKPARETLTALKVAGFHWQGGSWVGQRAKLPPVVS